MATVAITPIELTANTRSSDLVGAGTAITNAAANTFVITPPALLARLGATSLVLAASDLRMVVIEPGQHVQSDGTSEATCGDNGTTCYALFMPGYLNGGSAVAGA